MKIIVGLGNPGERYKHTRHNAGFDVIAGLARELGVTLEAGRGDFMSGEGAIADQDVLLVTPLTYVNESGRAVGQALAGSEGGPDDLLVICDDVNLELGRIRLAQGGGDGGHHGLASIIRYLETEGFSRLRLGTDRPLLGQDLAEYVLDRFPEANLAEVGEMFGRAIDAIKSAVIDGMASAMSRHNRRERPQRERLEDSEER